MAVDAAGEIYVANDSTSAGDPGSVTIYNAAGAQLRAITTDILAPTGLAVDASGKIYVANYASNTLTTYTASGAQTTPTIGGLSQPEGVAVDTAGKIHATNWGKGELGTYIAEGTPASPSISARGEMHIRSSQCPPSFTVAAATLQTAKW